MENNIESRKEKSGLVERVGNFVTGFGGGLKDSFTLPIEALLPPPYSYRPFDYANSTSKKAGYTTGVSTGALFIASIVAFTVAALSGEI